MPTWKEIWDRKGTETPAVVDDALASALKLNGYDAPTGQGLSADSFRQFAEVWAERVGYQPPESVYEIGSGSGAFLETIRRTLGATTLAGSDMSASLVAAGSKLFPDLRLEHFEARDVPPTPTYDHVVSFGVFIYFPSFDYARSVLDLMQAKAHRSVVICDVPDITTKAESEAFRRGAWSQDEYEKHYEGLEHTYFERSFFETALPPERWRVVIEDQNVPGYANSPYRFNVFATAIAPPS